MFSLLLFSLSLTQAQSYLGQKVGNGLCGTYVSQVEEDLGCIKRKRTKEPVAGDIFVLSNAWYDDGEVTARIQGHEAIVVEYDYPHLRVLEQNGADKPKDRMVRYVDYDLSNYHEGVYFYRMKLRDS